MSTSIKTPIAIATKLGSDSNVPTNPGADFSDFSKGVEFIPVFIFSLMIMTSFINQDVKGIFWMLFVIVGIFIITAVVKTFKGNEIDTTFTNTMLPLFATFYNTCSISSFLIAFTFMYLWLPMLYVNNINYSVIFIFLFFYFYDVLGRKKLLGSESNPNFDGIGTFVGTITGVTYGVFAVWILSSAGDKFMYFTPSASNKEYCSRPKNQQFKCNVYKNGQIISSL